jgi:hypothetical protein
MKMNVIAAGDIEPDSCVLGQRGSDKSREVLGVCWSRRSGGQWQRDQSTTV